MKNLFFTAAYLVAFVLSGMAQPFPLSSSASFDTHNTIDIKADNGFIYVLANYDNTTTLNGVLSISPSTLGYGFYVAKYEASSGGLVWVSFSNSTATTP